MSEEKKVKVVKASVKMEGRANADTPRKGKKVRKAGK